MAFIDQTNLLAKQDWTFADLGPDENEGRRLSPYPRLAVARGLLLLIQSIGDCFLPLRLF
jgi:hypothetical protein